MQTKGQIPQVNFLSVTINSQKLNDFLRQIKFLIKQQQETIEQHHRKFTFTNNSFNQRFIKLEFQLTQKSTKLKKQIINEAQIQKDLLFKTENNLLQKNQQLNDKLKEAISNIAQIKEALQVTSNKTNYVFQECKDIKNIKMKNQQFQANLKNINSEIYKLLNQEKQQQKINQINQICQQTFFKILQNDKVRNFVKGGCGNAQFINKLQPKKKNFTQNQALFYASVSQKLEKLEKQLLEKENQNPGRILYPSTNVKKQKDAQEKEKQLFSNQALKTISIDDSSLTQISNQIKTKLQSIQKIVSIKNQDLQNQFIQQKDKNIVMNDKVQILTRKLQKQKGKLLQLTNNFKRLAEKKVDQKLIEGFKFQIRKKSIDYQENLENKLSRDVYQKQKTKLNDRLKIIHQNLIQKADKSQVIKAIKFIQEKIKQIIFLIAGNKDDDREGAIKKKNFACLSCDKQLENKLSFLNQGFKLKSNNQSTGTLMRSTTSRMRRHIRLASTNITPQNID